MLQDLKNKYKKSLIPKHTYIEKMHHIHQTLFDYATYIKSTDIKKIEIVDDEVIMTSRENDIKMICSPNDYRIAPMETLNFGFYEKKEIDMIVSLLQKKATIFDIGANFGWYTITLRKKLKNSQIYSFEPIKSTFQYLKKNLLINTIKDVSVFNFGFSNKPAVVDFYFYPEGSGNASQTNLSHSKNVKKMPCKLVTLDSFLKKKNIKLDFIKCDVEGSELLVFQGGKKTLQKDKPIVFCEMLRKWSKEFNYHPNDIIHLFKTLGYRCFYIVDNHLKECKAVSETTKATNFFFLHNSAHSKLISTFT